MSINNNWIFYFRVADQKWIVATEKDQKWITEKYDEVYTLKGWNSLSEFLAKGIDNWDNYWKKTLLQKDGRKIGYIKKKRLELHKDLIVKYKRNNEMRDKFYKDIEKKIYIAKQDLTDAVKSDLKNRLKMSQEQFLLLLNEIIPHKSYESLIELYNDLQSINIFNKLNVSNNSFEPCPLFRDLKSKYRVDNNIYRILLINTETEKYFRLNILDFVSLFDIDIIRYVESKGIEIKELRDKRDRFNNNKQRLKDELKKYDDLLKKISNKQFLKQYTSLNKYLKSYWWFVKEFMEIGKENISKHEIVPADDIIFYSSCRYLQKRVSTYIDISLISRILNTLCVLGIMQKVFNPDNFNCNKYYKDYEIGHDINYFSVNNIDWEEANRRSEILINNKVKISSISRKKITNIFGKIEAEKVFSNPHVIKL